MSGWRSLVGMGRRTEVGVWSVIVVLLAVVAFGAVAAPRLLRNAEGSSLQQAIEQAPIGARQLAVRVLDDYPQGFDHDPLELQRRRLDNITAEMSADLLRNFDNIRMVADTNRFGVSLESVIPVPPDSNADPDADPAHPGVAPSLPTFLTFRVHPELDEHSRLVAGRRAKRSDRTINDLEVFEFELTPAAADELGWEVGEIIELTVDPSDIVTRSISGGLPQDFAAELVGLRELSAASDPYWSGDERLHRPTISDTGVGANVYAYAIVHADQLPTRPFLVNGRSPFALEQRSDLIDGAINLDNAAATLDGALQLEASFSTQPTLSRPGVVTGLRPILETEIDQRQAARSTLVLAAVGVLGVVLTTLAQILVAETSRRRGWLIVARARGASRPQVVFAAMGEMGLLAAIAAVIGGGMAWLIAPRVRTDLELPLLLAVWLGAVVCAGLLAVSEGLRAVTVSGRPASHPGLGRWGRIAGVLLVIVALAAALTFRRRGLAIDAPSIDLLVVLVPIVVPLAVVYLTRWVTPWVLRRIARRGLALGSGTLVGLRRVAASPDATIGIVTVIVLSLTVGALGVGVDRALTGGAVDASWARVGAAYRIDTRSPEVYDAVRSVPGATVAASGNVRANLERNGDTFGITVYTVDAAALQAITGGTAADQAFPAALGDSRLDGAIPVVSARRINGRIVRVGDRINGIGSRADEIFHIVEIRAEAFGRNADFIVADRGVVAAVTGSAPGFNTLAIDAPATARADLERIAAIDDETLAVRSDVLSQQLDDPLSRAVRRGYLLAAGFALLLSLVALVAVAIVTARQRQREVAILGLLGAGRREAANAVIAELAPAAIVGIVVGTIVGWFVARSYDGRYDLSAFADGSSVSIRADLAAQLLAAGAVALASLAVIALLVRRIVATKATDILRIDGAA